MADTPADISALELDALWAEFHQVVNMTSMELSAWLSALPEGVDPESGERVLTVLHKRRIDLTDEDVHTMYEVVDTVGDERRPVDDETRRHLMALGHDPARR